MITYPRPHSSMLVFLFLTKRMIIVDKLRKTSISISISVFFQGSGDDYKSCGEGPREMQSILASRVHSSHLRGCQGIYILLTCKTIFRCDSISYHLPLSVSQWVGQWVSGWLIVSDWRLLSHLRALRACFLLDPLSKWASAMHQHPRWGYNHKTIFFWQSSNRRCKFLRRLRMSIGLSGLLL